MSDLQRDIERVERMMECALPDGWDAWQRIRARLTPDRERVARAIAGEMLAQGHVMHGEAYWHVADAAIAAMEGKE